MIFGYARVSTVVQATDGNSLFSQVEKLKAAGAEEVFAEHYTGTTTNRPKFQELLTKLQPGDTLCVTKLDRFARTVGEGQKLIRELVDKGIKVNILNMGVVENTPVGRIIATMLLAFAEFERDMIVERCQEGRRIARRTKAGYREGRPPIQKEKIAWAMSLLDDGHSFNEVANITKIGRATLFRYSRERKAENL